MKSNNTWNSTWNPANTFSGTAHYYARFRPNYPKDVFDYLTSRFRINISSSILDLGCGTGQIALGIASSVKKDKHSGYSEYTNSLIQVRHQKICRTTKLEGETA
ncbi:MAG: class I SAM-dependent methyltransferase [Rickettsiales bacterium]|jgi:ubiquinone/menaquinone biosynthesis C-methylase UbiE|nr:class I SAM-dependent methyltransferase [Rickettsiales bacterium]